MSFKRAVFVADIHEFIMYLDECFQQLSRTFPWLMEKEPIDKWWPWTSTDRFSEHKTQCDYLIDWIVQLVLAENYYIYIKQEHNPEFTEVLGYLQTYFHFNENRRKYFHFPLLVGDIHPHQILRQSCWLYVELSYNPAQQKP